MNTNIHSEIRGPGLISEAARLEYRALSVGQPLLLTREPTNPVDGNAIIIKTVIGQPCGYLAREHAKIIAPELDRGVLWLAKVTAPKSAMRCPQVLLWKERRNEAEKFTQLASAYGATDKQIAAILGKKFLVEQEQ